MGIRERRNRVSRIPTIKYSSDLVIDQDKVIKVIKVIKPPRKRRTLFRCKYEDTTSDLDENDDDETSDILKQNDIDTDAGTMLSILYSFLFL